MKFIAALISIGLLGSTLSGQTAPSPPEMSDAEQDSLRQVLGAAGNSPVDFIRALESHLTKFPNSPRRAELERALVKSALDTKDNARIIRWGEKVLAREPDDAQVLERVTVALLQKPDAESAGRALKYAEHFEQLILAASKDPGGSGKEVAKLKDAADRGYARALILRARAEGLLQHKDKAVELAEKSFSVYPSVEGAHEAARWLTAVGKDLDAIRYLADAFSISELKATDPDARQDRERMGELYRKLKGSETGLGDMILKSYDETSSVFAARREQMRKYDPNAGLKDAMQFTLSGLEEENLKLSALRGKVIVMDFWATWCGPCRVQHPLYEQVKTKFKHRTDVVFLAVDTDDNRSLVKPFLEENKWSKNVYFEDGLGQLLQVTSIPTTLIFNKKGEVTSRMNGFVPETFVDMLTARIQEALNEPSPKTTALNGR